jgi:hypothetical protein
MKRLVGWLAFGVLMLAPESLPGQEPPHLEFVRGLRAHHYADLAEKYLENLIKDPAHAEDPLILLEMAKTRMELAAQETNTDRRLARYQQAGTDLEAFLTKYSMHPLAAEAQLEKAHISVLQGKTALGKFLRQESVSARNQEAVQARALLAKAGTELDTVAALIEKQRAQYTGEPKNEQEREERRALDQARLQVELDLGLNALDQAQTYLDDGSGALLAERGAIVKKAVEYLEKAGNRDSKNPTSWLARAWAAYAYQEFGDPEKSRTKLKDVATENAKVAEAGKRVARYYLMKLNFESPKEKGDPTAALLKDAESWMKDYAALKDYAPYGNTPEGYGVRFLLAVAHTRLGEKEAKQSVARKQHFDRARELCRALERSENDFAAKAQQTLIAVVQADGGFDKPADKLDKFDDCVFRAQYEAFQLNEEGKKEPPIDPKEAEKAEKKREERMKTIIAVLAHALELAKNPDNKVTPQEAGQAVNLLCHYYLFMGKHLSVVREGEPFVRAKPATEQRAATAIYVMEAYSLLLGERLKAGESIDDLAEERRKFRELAEYVESAWPNDAAGDQARHQLGILYFKENKPAEAIDWLGRIKPSYTGRVFAQELLARCALQADERKLPLAADKRPWEEKAYAALQSIPDLPAGADGATTDVYLQAKIELASLYLKAKKYEQVEQLIEPLLQKFPQYKLNDPARGELLRNELAQRKWYAYGSRAEAEYNAGHYDKVREQLGPVVEKLGKDELPELKENSQLARALIGLALRAHLQDKQLDKANEVLKVLQKSIDEGGGKDDGGVGVLESIAQLIQGQVTELRNKGDTEGVGKAIDGFAAFLDELVKQQKTMTPELARILGMCYASLEKHGQAIELLEKITEPKAVGGKEPEPALVENYRAARILYIRELRQDKKLDKAEAALKDVLKTDWGKQSFEIKKESLLQLDAQGKHMAATKEWDEIITKQLLPKINENATIKDQYFECHVYYFTAFLHYVQGQKEEAKRANYTRQLAVKMVKLEDAWPDLGGPVTKAKILGLLNEDAKLKEKVTEVKKASK